MYTENASHMNWEPMHSTHCHCDSRLWRAGSSYHCRKSHGIVPRAGRVGAETSPRSRAQPPKSRGDSMESGPRRRSHRRLSSRRIGPASDYHTEQGNADSASIATAESTEPDFLFEKVEMDSDDGDAEAWETAYEENHNNDAPSDVERMVPGAEAQRAALELSLRAFVTKAGLGPGRSHPDPEAATDTDMAKPTERRVANLLNTPLEVKLSSTPMDILWWILLGMLSVALAVVWSRVR
ncbi:hypothetical protein B0H13DRAFT_1952701 [Mycena leptocephala]|nr:hypothetical protein B0H13DRAFT_1952701 [Mycena leptocephala]